ncbi:hypothetical protein KEM54_001117 [Ascosphaera aggregata]|nr:hypothetical protein KEM54_001117 [Ascosphaera aggregata]
MRKPSVSQLVYRALYPNRGSDDPGSFAVHIGRYIVPELRVEVFNFYGNFEEIEAKYPGLDYSHPSHRLRLGRFPHHRQLFQAFDALGLTKDEMYWLCSWEGTKLARDRFEKDQGIKVVDTTGNDIKLASPSKPQMVEVHESPDEDFGRSCPVRPLSDDDASCDAIAMAADSEHCFSVDNPVNGCYITAHSRDRRKEDEEGSEDELAHALVNQISTLQNSTASNSDPFGFSLNQRLMAANAARVSGQHRLPLDAAYEQWLKEEIERDDPFSQHMRPELLRQSASSAAASSSNDDCLPALSEQRDTDAATARTRTSTPFTSTSDSVTSSAIDLTIDRRVRREAQAIADRRREELLRLNGADRQTFPFIAPSQTISAATTPRASDSNPPSSSSISATTLWAQYEPDISRNHTIAHNGSDRSTSDNI